MHKRVVIILVVSIAAIVMVERYGPGGRQRRGLKQLEEFRPQVEARIASDPRFINVELRGTTHPQVRFFGSVPDALSLDALRAIAQPPPNVEFTVLVNTKIISAATSQRSDTPR